MSMRASWVSTTSPPTAGVACTPAGSVRPGGKATTKVVISGGAQPAKIDALKGEVLARGVERVLGLELPVFEKRRFQHGAVSAAVLAEKLGNTAEDYRRHFQSRF